MRASTALAAAVLLGFGAVAGCSRQADTCDDVSRKICARLDQCQALERVFVDERQCLDSFNALFDVTVYDDARCRDEWSVAGNLSCPAFLDYYSI